MRYVNILAVANWCLNLTDYVVLRAGSTTDNEYRLEKVVDGENHFVREFYNSNELYCWIDGYFEARSND